MYDGMLCKQTADKTAEFFLEAAKIKCFAEKTNKWHNNVKLGCV